jgi:phytoene dehydrogenase-like protein
MNTKFDVIIIGAGIGGLVCGNYLVKKGLKVLIIEQHNKVGGYCTSFKRKGFIFDAGVHSLGDFYEDGQMTRLLNDLSLCSDIEFKKSEVSDIVVTPESKWEISCDIKYTVEQLKQYFPDQKEGIENFFRTVNSHSLSSLYLKYSGVTFYEALNEYFSNEKLKAIISMPVCNLGMFPYKSSAISAFILYKRFILGGGYYPVGGMQNFADLLAKKFTSLGGEILLSQKVTKILIKGQSVYGVYCNNNCIEGKNIVSNCDARQTFLELIENRYINNKFKRRLLGLKPSLSSIIIFLGLERKIFTKFKSCTALWYFKTYDIDDVFKNLYKSNFLNDIKGVLCCFPSRHDQALCPDGRESVFILLTVPFYNRIFWLRHKEFISERMISIAESLFGKFSSRIIIKEIATPFTLYRFTLNYKGALHGWESNPHQISLRLISHKTEIEGLYLTGHWVTLPSQGGIATVVYSGRKTAELIIKNFNKK